MSTALDGARFVGQSVPRREDPRLLSGRGRFVDDVVLPGMLHVAFLRSDVARGRIVRIDTSAAVAVEGVVAVFTGADLNQASGPMWTTSVGPPAGPSIAKPLAFGDVRFVGDPVALVVAESRYVAEDALELIDVEIEPLPPVLDHEAPLGDAPGLVHAELSSNVAAHTPPAADPRVDEIFATAAHIVTRTFRMARATNVPMEPRGIVASWDRSTSEITIWPSTQSPHELRAYAARLLGVPEGDVHVRFGDVGGGFGQKMFPTRDETAVLLAAKAVGRPLKWMEDRRENLLAAGHSRAQTATISAAVDDDGRILALDVQHLEDSGAYPVGGASSAFLMSVVMSGAYRIPAVRFESTARYTNTCGRTAYRGPWLMETVIREQLVDHIAREVGLDPLELRRRNVVRAEDLPYVNASGREYDSISAAETLEQAAAMVGWDDFRRRQAEARAEGRLLGVGLSLYVEPSAVAFGSWGTEEVVVRVNPDGSVSVAAGSGSHGHSLETTIPQVVADALGCALDDISFVQGDSDATPFGQGTGGSRSAVIGGGAAIGAAKEVRSKVEAVAAHLLEAAPYDLEVRGGRVSVRGVPTASVSFADVARAVYLTPGKVPAGLDLVAAHRFQPASPFTWSNACHAAVVEIDPATGVVRVDRFVVSEDCGVMINPRVVEGQIAGGVVQGIGGVLFEDFVYDAGGNPLTTTLLDYVLPTASDIPALEFGHIETPSSTPGGFRGMGEGGAIGAPAAVANAIADALAPLGVQVTDFPLGPSQVRALLASAPSFPVR